MSAPVWNNVTQSNQVSVKHEHRSDLYWSLIKLFFLSAIVAVMASQPGNRWDKLINSTEVWYSGTAEKVSFILTRQEAVHAERDVVERDGWTGSRSIFGAELQPKPAEEHIRFNQLSARSRRDDFLTGVMWERIYRASRQIPQRFAFGVRTLCLAPSVLLISLCSCCRFEQTQKKEKKKNKFVFFDLQMQNLCTRKIIYVETATQTWCQESLKKGKNDKRAFNGGLILIGHKLLLKRKPTLWTPLILMLS